MAKAKMDKDGVISSGKLNEVIIKETRRANGSLRIQQDFSNCPTLTEQHTAHLTDINYLIKKHTPDEMAAYLMARNAYRTEILGHDFSIEPNLQGAKNTILQSRKNFEALPEEVKSQFRSHVEFLKYIDIPGNAEKLFQLNVLTPDQVEGVKIMEPVASPAPTPTQATPT